MLTAPQRLLLQSHRASSTSSNTTTTWDSGYKNAHVTLTGGSLIASVAGSGASDFSGPLVRSTRGITTLKRYAEFTVTAAGGTDTSFSIGVGITDIGYTSGNPPGVFDDNGCVFYNATTFTGGSIWATNASGNAAAPLFTTGDVIGMHLDIPNNKVYFRVNATEITGQNVSAGTGGIAVDFVTPWYAYFNGADTASVTANFGATSFANSPASGYVAWDA